MRAWSVGGGWEDMKVGKERAEGQWTTTNDDNLYEERKWEKIIGQRECGWGDRRVRAMEKITVESSARESGKSQ